MLQTVWENRALSQNKYIKKEAFIVAETFGASRNNKTYLWSKFLHEIRSSDISRHALCRPKLRKTLITQERSPKKSNHYREFTCPLGSID